MRMSESEYQALINRRVQSMRDMAHQLNIPVPRNVRKLAEETISPAAFPMKVVKPRKATMPKGPNKTEASYLMRLRFEFPSSEVRFEAITLTLENGHRYTPDFVVFLPNTLLLIEVKNGAYKHASYGRSKMAFAQAQIDFPLFRFRWSEKQGGEWSEKNFGYP